MEKEPYQDQAEGLRSELHSNSREIKEKLPPRREVHHGKKAKTKVKVRYPLIKLLMVFFILLPLTVFSFYSYFHFKDAPLKTMEQDSKFVEEVSLEEAKMDLTEPEQEPEEGSASVENDDEEKIENEESINSDKELVDTKNGKGTSTSSDKDTDGQSSQTEENQQVQEQDESTEGNSLTEEYTILTHTVQSHETLFRISMNYYQSQDGIPLIKQWNNITNNEIKAGQVLQIPIPKD